MYSNHRNNLSGLTKSVKKIIAEPKTVYSIKLKLISLSILLYIDSHSYHLRLQNIDKQLIFSVYCKLKCNLPQNTKMHINCCYIQLIAYLANGVFACSFGILGVSSHFNNIIFVKSYQREHFIFIRRSRYLGTLFKSFYFMSAC